MFNNQYISLLFGTLCCISLNVVADTTVPVVKKPLPIECTDRENYDQTDCAKALELKQWVQNQDNIPDSQRKKNAELGEDLLVEKATGFRVGLHKIMNGNRKEASIAVKIGVPNTTQMFAISGDGCDIDHAIRILQDTSEFTFFYEKCESTDHRIGNNYSYYSFDKNYKRLDVLIQAANYQARQPILTLANGLYKLLWRNYNNGNGKFSMYFDYKITGNRPDDLKCIRAWDEDVGCNFDMISPLVSGKYKVIDE